MIAVPLAGEVIHTGCRSEDGYPPDRDRQRAASPLAGEVTPALTLIAGVVVRTVTRPTLSTEISTQQRRPAARARDSEVMTRVVATVVRFRGEERAARNDSDSHERSPVWRCAYQKWRPRAKLRHCLSTLNQCKPP